jgi:hypothetical protein
VYRGAWGIDGRIAYLEDPTGITALAHDCEKARLFEWGTQSPGTVELAAAIVSDLVAKDSRRTASQAQIRRLSELLAAMPHDGFALREGEIDRWIRSADHRAAEAALSTEGPFECL